MLEYTRDYTKRWNAMYSAAKARGILVGDEFSTKDSDGPGGFIFIGKAKGSFFVKLVLDGAISLSDPVFVIINSPKTKAGLITFLCKASVEEYLKRYQAGVPKVRSVKIIKRFGKSAVCMVTEWCE